MAAERGQAGVELVALLPCLLLLVAALAQACLFALCAVAAERAASAGARAVARGAPRRRRGARRAAAARSRAACACAWEPTAPSRSRSPCRACFPLPVLTVGRSSGEATARRARRRSSSRCWRRCSRSPCSSSRSSRSRSGRSSRPSAQPAAPRPPPCSGSRCSRQRATGRPGGHARARARRRAGARRAERTAAAAAAARARHARAAAALGSGVNARGERGTVASGRSRCSSCSRSSRAPGSRAGRGLLLDERMHGSADAVALAAASVLELRYGGDVDAGGAACGRRARRRARARAAARASLNGSASTLVSIEFERGPRDPSPLAVRVSVRPGARRGRVARAPASALRSPPRRWASASPTYAASTRRARSSRRRSRSSAGPTCGAARAAPRADSTARASSTTRSLRPGYRSGRLDRGRAAAARAAAARRRGTPGRAISCSSGGRRITSASSSRPGSPSRRRTAARASTSSRSAPAAGPAPGGPAACRAMGASGHGDLAVPGLRTRGAALAGRARGARRATAAGACSRRNSRPRADSTHRRVSPGGRAGHRAVHARYAGPAAGIRSASAAPSSPVRRSRPRRVSCMAARASGGDIASALGPTTPAAAVLAREWPRETRAYVARILRRFGGPATLEDTPPCNAGGCRCIPAGGRRRCACFRDAGADPDVRCRRLGEQCATATGEIDSSHAGGVVGASPQSKNTPLRSLPTPPPHGHLSCIV